MEKEKYVICETLSFSHPLSMSFSGRKWYDDDEYEWCDNRVYRAENVNVKVHIFSDGKCTLKFGEKYRWFVEECKEKKMMCRTRFNSPKELIKYFLTDPLFELPIEWQDYMTNSYQEVKRYTSQHVKRHVNFGYWNFNFTEYRGAFNAYDVESLKQYGDICPLPKGMRTWGYDYDIWSETHGYVELGEHCSWDKSRDTYVVYNIKDYDPDYCIDKYFKDFYIFNELAFYKFMKNVDPTLNHSVVYETYRRSFSNYEDGFKYKDKELDFDHVFSVYVEQSNIKQQEELDELNRQIAELEAKRNKCFKNYG